MKKLKGDNSEKQEVVKEKSREVISYYLKEPYVPFVICLLLSITADAFIPLGFFPNFIRVYVGLAFLLLSLFIMRWAIKHMALNGETWSPMHIESRVLIVFGPYHYSRNPMFISAILAYIALFIFLNNIWGFIFLIPLILILNKYIIEPRENLFMEKYEETYADYHNKTGRWL